MVFVPLAVARSLQQAMIQELVEPARPAFDSCRPPAVKPAIRQLSLQAEPQPCAAEKWHPGSMMAASVSLATGLRHQRP